MNIIIHRFEGLQRSHRDKTFWPRSSEGHLQRFKLSVCLESGVLRLAGPVGFLHVMDVQCS